MGLFDKLLKKEKTTRDLEIFRKEQRDQTLRKARKLEPEKTHQQNVDRIKIQIKSAKDVVEDAKRFVPVLESRELYKKSGISI